MGLRNGENWSVEVVEAVSCVPREFQMLSLILADGDMCCPISEVVSNASLLTETETHTDEQGYRRLGAPDKRRDRVAAVLEHPLALTWYPLVIGVYSAKSPSAVNATISGYSVLSPRADETLTFH